MKTLKMLAAAMTLSIFSFGAFAQSVTATSDTITSAEAIIAQKAQEAGASGYKITSARMGNYATVSAVLIK
ncbi:DUF1471 domain-containing protein [Providencia sp. PROV202]|uniref:DUF1471 domain-containing protein n=1 Tax=Providencia sp. PROV202 TaxID=2949902 RepID=UPI00234B7C2F|nr:DUF1471 domain-containing protein [Providencia sp. PROV202]